MEILNRNTTALNRHQSIQWSKEHINHLVLGFTVFLLLSMNNRTCRDNWGRGSENLRDLKVSAQICLGRFHCRNPVRRKYKLNHSVAFKSLYTLTCIAFPHRQLEGKSKSFSDKIKTALKGMT